MNVLNKYEHYQHSVRKYDDQLSSHKGSSVNIKASNVSFILDSEFRCLTEVVVMSRFFFQTGVESSTASCSVLRSEIF